MRMKKMAPLAILILILGAALVAGCGGSDARLNIVGSTSVQPIAESLAEAFMKEHPGASINVQGGGSSAGIKAIADGTAGIGTSSRPLHPGEAKPGVAVTEIALDGIAVVVHPQNPVNGLTMEQLRAIFAGAITDWSALGGPKRPIVLVNREEGSGTRGAFAELVMGETKLAPKTLVQGSTGAVRQTVAGSPDAIGYISLAAADASVKILPMNGVICSVATVRAKQYPIVRPFLFIHQKEAGETVAEFLQYVLGEGQSLVVKEGLVAVK